MRVQDFSFLQKLSDLTFVKGLYLFGSRARGDHSDRSDIDLAIWCPEASDQEWLDVLALIEDADTLLRVDCVRLDHEPEDSQLLAEIMRDKQTLYEQSETQY